MNDGYLVNFANNSRLVYVGGKIGTNEAVDSIYEFESDNWQLWPNRLPWPLSEDDTFTSVTINQCLDPNNQDVKLLNSLDSNGEEK